MNNFLAFAAAALVFVAVGLILQRRLPPRVAFIGPWIGGVAALLLVVGIRAA